MIFVQTTSRRTNCACIRRACSRHSAIICTYSTLVTYNGSRVRRMRVPPNITKTRPPFHVIPFETLEVTESLECIRGCRVQGRWQEVPGVKWASATWGHRLQPAEENLIVTNSCLYLRLLHHELSLWRCGLVSLHIQLCFSNLSTINE